MICIIGLLLSIVRSLKIVLNINSYCNRCFLYRWSSCAQVVSVLYRVGQRKCNGSNRHCHCGLILISKCSRRKYFSFCCKPKYSRVETYGEFMCLCHKTHIYHQMSYNEQLSRMGFPLKETGIKSSFTLFYYGYMLCQSTKTCMSV